MSKISAIIVVILILLLIGERGSVNQKEEDKIRAQSILPVISTRSGAECDYQKTEKELFYKLLGETHQLDSLIKVQNNKFKH
jgi:hypothetical protein